MDADLLLLFSDNGRVKEIPPKALVVYLILRADILQKKGTDESRKLKRRNMLASAMPISEISEISGFTDLEIKIQIDELEKLKLVKRNDTYYQLGEYSPKMDVMVMDWYKLPALNKPKTRPKETYFSPKVQEQYEEIKRRAKRQEAEQRAVGSKLQDETKRRLIQQTVGDVRKQVVNKNLNVSKTLFELYAKLYMKKFGKTAKFATGEPRDSNDSKKIKEGWAKTGVYMRRYFHYFNENMEFTQKVLNWTFENWDSIRQILNLKIELELEIGLLTSNWFMEKCKLWITQGLPTWKIVKTKSKSNERLNRTYERGAVQEDFGSDTDTYRTSGGDFG